MDLTLYNMIWALLIVGLATAQGTAHNQTTWGSVVVSYHGEHTPLLSTKASSLTPLGAQQALQAGQAIRTRLVSGPGTNITKSLPIRGISKNNIENTQLYLLAADDNHIAASAYAFLQGVYPPVGNEANDSQNILANGSTSSFPLDGYQYPIIETISPLDLNYLWYVSRAHVNQPKT
jgi:hypothetical protein